MSAMLLVGIAVVIIGFAAIKWGMDIIKAARKEMKK